jgi:hypothetical protein
MDKKLITFENVNHNIVYAIYAYQYLAKKQVEIDSVEIGYLRGQDVLLSFTSFICSQVKLGRFDKSEIQPIIQQFKKIN